MSRQPPKKPGVPSLSLEMRRPVFARADAGSYLQGMASAEEQTKLERGTFAPLVRFLPMLWPNGQLELKARVVAAVVLVLAGKAAVLVMPFAYKAVIDRMGETGSSEAFTL